MTRLKTSISNAVIGFITTKTRISNLCPMAFFGFICLQVYLLKVLQSNRDLLEESRYLRQILDMLTLEKMAAHLTHESLALKFHYLSCVLEHAGEAMKKTGNLDALIKRYSSHSLINWYFGVFAILLEHQLTAYMQVEHNLDIVT